MSGGVCAVTPPPPPPPAQFVKNNRGIDKGPDGKPRDLPRDRLERLFDAIALNEIKILAPPVAPAAAVAATPALEEEHNRGALDVEMGSCVQRAQMIINSAYCSFKVFIPRMSPDVVQLMLEDIWEPVMELLRCARERRRVG